MKPAIFYIIIATVGLVYRAAAQEADLKKYAIEAEGTILQVVPDSGILSENTQGELELARTPVQFPKLIFIRTDPEGMVDDAHWGKWTIYEIGTYSYIDALGTVRTVKAYTAKPKNFVDIITGSYQNLFDGTWVGTIKDRFGLVKFTLYISAAGTVEADTSKRGSGGPRDTINDGKTMTWYWGVDGKTKITFTPNSDGKTAVMTATGPAIRNMSALNESAVFQRTSP
jgi:hypothetical protein